MRKILLHNLGRAPMILDQNSLTCTEIDRKYSLSTYSIEYIYLSPEDLEIRYKDGKNTVVKNVDKGDVIVKFPDAAPNPIVILKNKDFKKNLLEKVIAVEKNRAADTVCADFIDLDNACHKCCESC